MTTGTRAAVLLTAFLLGSALSTSRGSAFGLVGNVSAGLGGRWGSDPLFGHPIHKGGIQEPSVNIMLGHRALPILLEGYVSGTRRDVDDSFDDLFRETRTEVGLGAAGIWRVGPIYSHVGGGIARVYSRTKQLDSLEPKESSVTRTGHWIGVGAFYPLVAGFNVGAIGRYADVRSNPGHLHGQLGGSSASAVIGWGSLSAR
jgi:hypothetical protein